MTDQENVTHEVTPEIAREARANPNGWVYKIEGQYALTEYVPSEAVMGAWKVDADGNVVGDFIPNPKYREAVSRLKK